MQFQISNFKFKILEEGYIAISSVVIILAVILSLTITMSYSAIGEAQSGLALFQGEENLHQVEGCVEDLMLKIRSSASYNGTTITRPEGICTIVYTSSGPANWDVTVTFQSTTSTNIGRSIRAVFTRSATQITLISWNEV